MLTGSRDDAGQRTKRGGDDVGSQRGRPSDVDMYSKDRGAYPATGCARAVTRRAGGAVRARTGAPRTAERVEAMDCIVRTRVCRRKCDTRRSKISLCPRGGALLVCFRRLLLGRDRGRDNFIFFQVGKGRGLIPPRPDVLLLVLRKYKAPGPRRLPPRHRNNRPPSLSSSPLRQIISHLLCSTAVPSASSGSLHAGATA